MSQNQTQEELQALREALKKVTHSLTPKRLTAWVECDVCGRKIEVRNSRGKHYCSQECFLRRGLVSRYVNVNKGRLTKGEREAILGSRTTRSGPFTEEK